MLGNTGAREYVRELVRLADLLHAVVDARIDAARVVLGVVVLMQRVLRRALHRLVELGQRAVHRRAGMVAGRAIRILVRIVGCEEATDALSVHAERLLAVRRIRAGLAVADIRHIVAIPLALLGIPPDELLVGVDRLAIFVTGGAVVEHVDVVRPAPCIVRIDTAVAVIILLAALRQGLTATVDTGVNPHAAIRRAVRLDLADAV